MEIRWVVDDRLLLDRGSHLLAERLDFDATAFSPVQGSPVITLNPDCQARDVLSGVLIGPCVDPGDCVALAEVTHRHRRYEDAWGFRCVASRFVYRLARVNDIEVDVIASDHHQRALDADSSE